MVNPTEPHTLERGYVMAKSVFTCFQILKAITNKWAKYPAQTEITTELLVFALIFRRTRWCLEIHPAGAGATGL